MNRGAPSVYFTADRVNTGGLREEASHLSDDRAVLVMNKSLPLFLERDHLSVLLRTKKTYFSPADAFVDNQMTLSVSLTHSLDMEKDKKVICGPEVSSLVDVLLPGARCQTKYSYIYVYIYIYTHPLRVQLSAMP